MKLCGVQSLTEYVRSPSSPSVDSTPSPIFLPTVPDKKPRTECVCQPVDFINSFAVAPPGRLSRSRTLAVLLPSRALAAGFACLAPLGALWPFLAGVAFFPAFPLAGATRGFCARVLAFLGGSRKTGTACFVSALLVLIFCRSPFAAAAAITTFITPARNEGKAIPPDSGENLSRARKRALESPGRAWR